MNDRHPAIDRPALSPCVNSNERVVISPLTSEAITLIDVVFERVVFVVGRLFDAPERN